MDALVVPQIEDAYDKADKIGVPLISYFTKNKVSGIKIIPLTTPEVTIKQQNIKKTAQYGFKICSDFDLSNYGEILAELISEEDYYQVMIHCAHRASIKELFSTVKNILENYPSNTMFEISGDLYSIHVDKNYSILKINDSLFNGATITAFFLHSYLMPEEIDIFDKLDQELNVKRSKKEFQVSVKGILSIYDEQGTIQLEGHTIRLIRDLSKYQIYVNNQKDKFKKIISSSPFQKKKQDNFTIPSEISTPYKIGIITPKNSQGYQDFITILDGSYSNSQCNEKKIQKYHDYVPTKFIPFSSSENIIQAINEYNQDKTCHCIAIIRGGGSKYDLMAFHDAELAAVIANSPIPIILGIGHSTDKFLCSEAAALSGKTPTDAASKLQAHIKKKFSPQKYTLKEENKLLKEENQRLKEENEQLKTENKKLKSQTFFSKLTRSLFHK